MKFKEKLLILSVAVVVSFFGFNLIASSSVCLLTIAKEAGYETIESYRVNCDVDTSEFVTLKTRLHNSTVSVLETEILDYGDTAGTNK